MIASEDIRRVTFDKAMRGYRCEDVDDYLKQAADTIDALHAENDDQQKKLVVLAQRIDQYRAEEDTLHTTLINAQRLGENVIKEAKQKAAEVLRAANIKAEDREQRARDEVELSKQELTTLKRETSDFKKTLLGMYRKHIELISGIPEYAPSSESAGSGMESADIPPMEQASEPMAPVAPPSEPQAESSQPVYDASAYPEDGYAESEAQAESEPEILPQAPIGEGKIDTVEFAIAPKDDAVAAQSTAEFQADYKRAFAPGAGLYDAPVDDDKPVSRTKSTPKKSSGRRGKKAASTQEDDQKLPDAFNSFSGIDFDS